ncbi:MAG: HNH endonuclease [Bacteroidales bacterium]|nr:HNH endonuclease [Candidatus Cryptobacteroides caccocaballi]
MSKAKYSVEDVRQAVAISKSTAGVLRQLGLKPLGGNYKTINRIVNENNIDTNHFTGKGWNVGLKFRPNQGMTADAIFKEDSAYKCSWRLREQYKKLSGKNYCESCGLTEWRNQAIPLEIHHINGNNRDNRVENLQLLCPNCHAQTKHYRGRGKASVKEKDD